MYLRNFTMKRVFCKMRPLMCLLLFLSVVMVIYLILRMDSTYNSLRSLGGEVYYLYLIYNFDVKKQWFSQPKQFCDGKFTAQGMELARLKDVVFEPEGQLGKYYIRCDSKIAYKFNDIKNPNHLNDWLKKLQYMKRHIHFNIEERRQTTLAVFRYEYANLFHQMTDYYNAFLIMHLFNIHPDKMDILLVDKSAHSQLDQNWDDLFGNVTFAKRLSHPVLYSDLIWGVLGYNSPLNFHSMHSLSFVSEFSDFVKSRFGASKSKSLDCSGVSILFLWRRDYVAHPGNPTGLISRKVQNENELMTSMQYTFPGHSVAGIQLDEYSMKDQIHWISQTDILVAMHGAGLSHILFLPSHAGVLELYPTYWPKTNRHFRAMARWKNLHYFSWQNTNPNNEHEKFYTYIPSLVVTQRVQSLYYDMCGKYPSQTPDSEKTP